MVDLTNSTTNLNSYEGSKENPKLGLQVNESNSKSVSSNVESVKGLKVAGKHKENVDFQRVV